jgi:hypothetical protein
MRPASAGSGEAGNVQDVARGNRANRPRRGVTVDWDALFGLSSTVALAGWAVLILAPRGGGWGVLENLPRLAIPLALSVVYTVLAMGHFAAAGGGFGSIAGVRTLFASDPVLVAGWIHFLAFDLIVGCLLADRMDRAGVPRVVQAAPLLLTFLLGPAGLAFGLLTEFVTRALRRRRREG